MIGYSLFSKVPACAAALTLMLAAPALAAEGAHHPRPPRGLPCSASVTIKYPHEYTTAVVRVRTIAGATVTAVAHYLTVNITESGIADQNGVASIPYYISLSTPWYRVHVALTTAVLGKLPGSCTTWFTPQL